MWGDNDITYLQQMISPERIVNILARGIFLRRLGIQYQKHRCPLILEPFSTGLNVSGRNMKSVGMKKPLSILTGITLKRLCKERMLLLSTVKKILLSIVSIHVQK